MEFLSLITLILLIINNISSAPTENVFIVEPNKGSNEKVSIVEAQSVRSSSSDLLRSDSLVTEIEIIPKQDQDELVTVVDDDRQPLPDTSSITRDLIEKLHVTNFFQLWIVFNEPNEINLQTGREFSILAPQQSNPPVNYSESEKDDLKKMLLDHVILGQRLHLQSRQDLSEFNLIALSGRDIKFTHRDGSWYANEAKVTIPETEISKDGEVIVVENYIFNDYKSNEPTKQEELKQEENNGNLANELSKLPAFLNLTREPIFNKYMKESNVADLLVPGELYTVLFPMDRAFQKWHPIDWGFYPFSVPEFASETVKSHFLKGVFKYDTITDNQTAITLTNRTILFRKSPAGDLTANGVSVMRKDISLSSGTVLIVPDILFIDHQVVQELRKHNKDKETPPLLTFPWWNAQFLSHAYLSIETDPKFSSIQRIMNVVTNLHLKVPGKNYSFFVPTNEAFERAELDVPKLWSDRNIGSSLSEETITAIENFVVRHIVPRRIYQKELQDGMILQSLDNSTHKLQKLENGKFTIDDGSVIEEGDIFVYNLGTMFYVDGILGSEKEINYFREILKNNSQPIIVSVSELMEEGGEGVTIKDVLLEDTPTTTPTTTTTTESTIISTTIKTSDNDSKNSESNDIIVADPVVLTTV